MAGCRASVPPPELVVRVSVMFDQAPRAGKGLSEADVVLFRRYQERARREFAASGISFALSYVDGAYVRQQGHSEIPWRFLRRGAINLFVTGTLGYDIDRDRTGGASMGPRAPAPAVGGDPYYKTFLGLRDARELTLPHEYAHHFTLDTTRRPGAAANFWADLRNDYWLWRQRRGEAVAEFRACAGAEFVVPR